MLGKAQSNVSVLVLLFLPWLCLCAVACALGATKDAEDLIRAVYEAHQPWKNREIALNNKAQLSSYFDERLTLLFMSNDECATRLGMCNLDFDPFLNAQDYEDNPRMNLRIKKASPEPDLSYRITFDNIGPRTMIYHLRNTEAGWRISDIDYPNGPSLVQILSGPKPGDEVSYPGWIELCNGHVTGAPQAGGTAAPHIVWTAYYSKDPRSKLSAHFQKLLGDENHTKDSACDRWSILRQNNKQALEICDPGSDGPWTSCEKLPPPEATTIVVSSLISPM